MWVSSGSLIVLIVHLDIAVICLKGVAVIVSDRLKKTGSER